MRLCCGCHQRKDPRELIRLQIGTKGSLVPVKNRIDGRSAWVCFNKECVKAIVRHPKKTFRSLRVSVDTTHLENDIVEWLWRDICSTVQAMNIDGCISSQQTLTGLQMYISSTPLSIQEYFTDGQKYVSNVASSTQCQPIYLTSHKLLHRLLRDINMYKIQ